VLFLSSYVLCLARAGMEFVVHGIAYPEWGGQLALSSAVSYTWLNSLPRMGRMAIDRSIGVRFGLVFRL